MILSHHCLIECIYTQIKQSIVVLLLLGFNNEFLNNI